MVMRFPCSIFSTSVAAPFELIPDWLPPTEGTPLPIELSDTDPRLAATANHCHWEGDDTLVYTLPKYARFRVAKDGIHITPTGQTPLPVIREILLGPVFALLMHLRGDTVLHAAALQLADGRGILLLADSGIGKSTLSAAALTRGARLINEDVTVLRKTENGIHVLPGWPVMRLEEQTATEAGLEASHAISVTGSDKSAWRVPPEQFCTKPVPLSAIYLLRRGKNSLNQSRRGDALQQLMEHIYPRRILRPVDVQRYFSQAAELLRAIPVSALSSEEGANGLAFATKTLFS